MVNLNILDREAYKSQNLKCFYIEYMLYKDEEGIVVREIEFSKSVSELINVDLTYKLSQFYGLDNYTFRVDTITELDY